MGKNIKFNDQVKLVVSDVDETIADLFIPASLEMISELNSLLANGIILLLVSGSGLSSIKSRVTDLLHPDLRKQVLISHCSGAEIVGFDKNGSPLEKPYHSLYDKTLTGEQKKVWREIVNQVISEFQLQTYPPMPLSKFKEQFGDNPLAVMYEDRGPQITFEFVNAYQLTSRQIEALRNHFPNYDMADLRIPVAKRAEELLEEKNIPITPRLGGMFALDLALKGVSKTTSIQRVINSEDILSQLNLSKTDVLNPEYVEIWGDKFSVLTGTDRHMSEAFPKEVRSVDFREENPEEFPEGYNIVVWKGEKHLHEGLLEYLKTD